jgi:hypothetical protein
VLTPQRPQINAIGNEKVEGQVAAERAVIIFFAFFISLAMEDAAAAPAGGLVSTGVWLVQLQMSDAHRLVVPSARHAADIAYYAWICRQSRATSPGTV